MKKNKKPAFQIAWQAMRKELFDPLADENINNLRMLSFFLPISLVNYQALVGRTQPKKKNRNL